MIEIDVDFETRSAVDLKSSGITRYAEDPSTRILCMCFSVNHGEIHAWVPGMPVPPCFNGPFKLVAHNAAFELAIWRLLPEGFHYPCEVECTMIAAYQRNLPGALVDVVPALGLSEKKDKAGTTVMRKMCRHDYEQVIHNSWLKKASKRKGPSTTEAWFRAEIEIMQDFRTLVEYCKQDVRAEQGVHRAIRMKEPELFNLDHRINSRGIWVDVITCSSVLELIDLELEDLNTRLETITDGAIHSGRQVGALLIWLRSQGYTLEGINVENVQSALDNPEGLTPAAIEALQIRQKLGLGSVGKFKAILNGVTSKNRVHDLVQLRGASQTGRYAGRRIQLQNLPRLELGDADVEMLIHLFRNKKRDTIRFLYGDVFYAAKQLIRPMFGSTNGMIVSDFAQIEARLVAWISSQFETLDAFKDENRDPYVEMAAKIYGVPVNEVTKIQRHIGKTCVLGAGYGLGGTGLTERMNREGVPLTEEEGQKAIDTYRFENKNTVNLWYRLEDAMVECVENPGRYKSVNPWVAFQSFDDDGTVGVQMILPSGRRLYFHQCKIEAGKFGDEVTFLGGSSERTGTYGGKLMENLIQAIANDLLNFALLNIDKAGYEIVLHVHDEIVVQNVKEIDVEKITSIMETVPNWAKGFPLKAETKFCNLGRYTK